MAWTEAPVPGGRRPAARGGYKRPFDLALLGLALVLLVPAGLGLAVALGVRL